MTNPPNRTASFLRSLNTHKIANSGALSIIGALVAIILVGAQPAVDDHLIGSGFVVEASRGIYDAFVRYAAMPLILALVAAGGLASYLGRPVTVISKLPDSPPVVH